MQKSDFSKKKDVSSNNNNNNNTFKSISLTIIQYSTDQAWGTYKWETDIYPESLTTMSTLIYIYAVSMIYNNFYLYIANYIYIYMYKCIYK